MKQANISIVTLGVEDLDRSTRFYQKLGWVLCEPSNDSVSFLSTGRVGIVLGLFGRAALAEDANVAEFGEGFRGVSLAFNLPDREAVDRTYAEAIAAGARPNKRPKEVFWGGYSGYFSDPDGHLWEIAHNPFITMDENGRFELEPKA